MIGIYKITSPTGRVYIGQTINLEERIKTYKRGNCKNQIKVKRSFEKHGIHTHIFQIIKLCRVEELNDAERYFQDTFDCLGKNGLNCKLSKSFDKNGFLSEETKARISKGLIGITKGKKVRPDIIEIIRITSTGRVPSLEARQNMSNAQKGRQCSDAAKEKIRRTLIFKKYEPSESARAKATIVNSKLVFDTLTGIYYDSAKELSIIENIPHSTLTSKLNNSRLRNNTKYIYA